MGFTRDVKLELDTVVPEAEHCRRAQLSGILFGAGTFGIGPGGRYTVRISLALPATARHVLALLKRFGVEAELRTVDSAPVGLRYEVVLGDEARDLQLLNELGVLSDDLRVQMTVPRRLVERRCCLIAFLRGLFLGCGSISAPGAPVHVEFTVEASFAEQVQRLLARLDLPFKLTSATATSPATASARRRPPTCWPCSARTRRACAGRSTPCSAACARAPTGRPTATRPTRGGRRPRRSARPPPPARAHGVAGVGRPAGSLREAAELRLAYPYLSLQELAAAADPPLSKSALNHRLRRLVALAGDGGRLTRAALRRRRLHAARDVGRELAEPVRVAAHLVVVPAEDLDVRERHAHGLGPARAARRRRAARAGS